MSFSEEIYRSAQALSEARAARLEEACEQAIQGGVSGVLIDGDLIAVDGRVPYGRIYDVTACGAENVVDWRTGP